MQFWTSSSMERIDSPEPWRYGDEASLYSIAEDSREDRVSVSANNNNVPLAGLDSIAAIGGNQSKEASSNKPVGVELCISDGDLTKSSDEVIRHYQKPHGNRRRCQLIGVACIMCTVVGGILASVLFTQFNRTATENRSASAINSDEQDTNTDGQVAAADESDGDSDSRMAMAKTHVFNALNQCLGLSQALLDPTTGNGQIYEALVQEVFDGSSKDDAGIVVFAELHGEEFIQERYALEMLYHATNGDSWLNSGGWKTGSTTSDPCSWYGVSCERLRILGTCAVTGVALDENNLSGELPQEFCCLPCVKSITMANNDIGGPILACLATMPTLKTINFTNNTFDSLGSSEARPRTSASP